MIEFKIHFYIFIIFILKIIPSRSEPYCNIVEEKSPTLRLKRHLFCDYDSTVRPVDTNNNRTNVNIIFIPKLMEFDDYSNIMSLHTWTYISWKDIHATWKPSDFEEVDSMTILSHEIWTPDISIHNSGSAGSDQDGIIGYTNCVLNYKGSVVCVPSVEYTTRCDPDHSYWPFDTVNCTFELASWSYSSEEIFFTPSKVGIVLNHFSSNSEWSIVFANMTNVERKSKYSSYNHFPTIAINMVLERSSSPLFRVFTTPVILMTVMTLTTLWLDPESTERLIVACVNIVAHYFCFHSLQWSLPQSVSVPYILILYHNSLLLASASLLLTCLLRRILLLKNKPPIWLSNYINIILMSKVGQILLLSTLDSKVTFTIDDNSDDSNNLVNEDTQKKNNWNYVIILIGWISFFSFLLYYIIMFSIYIHFSPSKENIKLSHL